MANKIKQLDNKLSEDITVGEVTRVFDKLFDTTTYKSEKEYISTVISFIEKNPDHASVYEKILNTRIDVINKQIVNIKLKSIKDFIDIWRNEAESKLQ